MVSTLTEYFNALSPDRREPMEALRKAIKTNLPKGFAEDINYKMPTFVVPHKLYPDGYHCDPRIPLPFISMASQKGFIALYHMGIYMNPELELWLRQNWDDAAMGKLDMGKSCIRFKKMDKIPYALIGQLASKMTVEDWVKLYESKLPTKK